VHTSINTWGALRAALCTLHLYFLEASFRFDLRRLYYQRLRWLDFFRRKCSCLWWIGDYRRR
jgi:hypothetical protein